MPAAKDAFTTFCVLSIRKKEPAVLVLLWLVVSPATPRLQRHFQALPFPGAFRVTMGVALGLVCQRAVSFAHRRQPFDISCLSLSFASTG